MPPPLTAWIDPQPIAPGPAKGQFRNLATGRHSTHTTQAVVQSTLFAGPALDRGALIRKALALSLRSRFDPAQSTAPIWQPSAPEYRDHLDAIKPLLELPIWDQVQAIAAPAFLLDGTQPIGMVADAIIRNPKTNTLAILLLHTRPENSIPSPVIEAELGAAVRMAADTYRTLAITKAAALWAAPGKASITWHDPDQCTLIWADILDIFNFTAPNDPSTNPSTQPQPQPQQQHDRVAAA